jgi:HK97 family phage portal protein
MGWLYAVVFRIALGCSEVEWTLFDTSNQEKPKQIYKHPILTLLKQVNPFQTSNEFIALHTIYKKLIGESFWALNFNALGEPAEIVLPYPNKMSVVPDKNFPFVKGYVYGSSNDAIPFDVNEVIHFKEPNPLNQYRGLGAAQTIGINLDAEQNADKWVNQFFYNSARPDGVIQFDYNLSDEQFDKLKKQWSEKYKGVSKAHQVALLEGGGKYLQIQNTIKDMDFANLKQKNRDVILGVFGMPQSVMGISENVNKANAEAGDYTFARWIVKPLLDWDKAKIQEQLIPKFRKSENLTLGFKEVVPETAEQKRLDAESAVRGGFWTVNEARIATGKDAIINGDVTLVPLNLIPTPIENKAEIPSGEMGQPSVGDTAENIASGEKLSGVQIQAAITVLRDYINGNIPAIVAVELLVAVGIDRDRAQAMVDACESFEPSNTPASPPAPTEQPKSKGLTPDQKRLHWETYAKSTERQEEMFNKVFESVFNEQKNQVIEQLKRYGKIPRKLDDEKTAKKFEPAITLVYESSFQDAIPKQFDLLDEFAQHWIKARSLTLAKSINMTTMEALRNELALGFEAGESIQQLSKRIEGYFTDNAKTRANIVSRTETIAASNEGALHRYEVEGVNKSEFYPSPDACSECLPLAGEYITKDSHGMIPVHPNCRCVWLPVV